MRDKRAQSTVEFTFVMIIILFLIYGMVRVFRWVGMDLAERRVAHDQTLVEGVEGAGGDTANKQLQPDFYRPKRINAVYHGDITK